MSVDHAAPTRPPAHPPRSTLGELRALLRGSDGDVSAAVRRLLDGLTDVVDVEAAGNLLRRYADRLRDGFVGTRVALLGSSTLDPVPALLTAAAVRRRLLPEIRLAGFNQWRLEIAAGAPDLADLRPRLVACLLDDSAVFAGVADPVDPDQVAARCAAFPAELAAWVSAARDVLGGLVVLTTVPLSPLRRYSVISYAGRARVEAAWARMNAAISELASASTVVLSADGLSHLAGVTFADDRMRHVAAHAYAPEYLLAYAEELARVAAADLGRSGKCLVLDLDDTLWGGTVGDVGTGGLRLGGTYPGSAHAELQAFGRDLAKQGVLLTLSSKNDQAVATAAIEEHPEMLLRADAFAATRINWDPKPDNLRAMAEELNIGLDSMVFVDDNPVERELMRRLAPEVTTVELPADPARYTTHLATRGDFTVLTLTDEDRDRTNQYRARAAREALARTATDLTEHLVALGSRLTVEPYTPLNAARIVQLFGKTNQFNLTGIRYSADDVAALTADGRTHFYAARLSDRFGDNGLIAALALTRQPDGAWSIDNFVLSCRVFGRNVEDAIVGLVLRSARAAGAPSVLGTFRRTERNQRFADFYRRCGFRPIGPDDDTHFRHDLGQFTDLPAWIEITHSLEVFHVA
ncbi:MAG TPA: HAD-IIIC family phosphatase [Micromonosporaceae bacterium]